MPAYFFHVAIELFPEHTGIAHPTQTSLQFHPPPPPSPAAFFRALKPFASSTSRRTSRDTAYDRKRDSAPSGARPHSALPAPESLHVHPHSDARDHRLDAISIESADMASQSGGVGTAASGADNIIGKGIGSSISSHYLKGRYEPVTSEEDAQGWGIVHLYRDSEETAGLYGESAYKTSDLWANGLRNPPSGKAYPPPKDDECTTLCILAVPSYMTPSDFLSFVGEGTRSQVSHFRMVRTARANRYMVLMKFKHGKEARMWQNEWNGKIFNSMEPETCHVVFLKSVELFQTSGRGQNSGLSSPTTSYPRMTNDPFIPPSSATKPLAPRTPSLIELPTCPVCLERMDETSGLLTIPCQHVFHCTCLEKWSGGGCPVCRYTHDDFSSRLGSHKYKTKLGSGEYELSEQPLECESCRADTSLWQCLICGRVGCGRYEGKHAYAHFEESGHMFSMDLESKRVWDYAGDGYVHRILADGTNPGEKLVELPGRRRDPTALEGREDLEVEKMENIALEYTHLLTSQLDSQRVYFEEVVQRAVDKASQATKDAELATAESRAAIEKVSKLEGQHDFVAKGLVPELEKEKARLEKRAGKFEEMARSMEKKYQEEKTVNSSLLERVKFLEETQLKELKSTVQRLEEENATKELLMEGLRDEHRDAMMQISAQAKLNEMVANGELDPEDLAGATIEAGPAPKRLPVRKARKPVGGSAASQSPAAAAAPANPAPDPFYNDVFATTARGEGWDAAKARAILDEARAKLLDQGLLVDSTPGFGDLGSDEDLYGDGVAVAEALVGDGEWATATASSTKSKVSMKKKKKKR